MSSFVAPVKQEYMARNPGVSVSKEETTLEEGNVFDPIGRSLGKRALAAGILDEGKRQPQFGSAEGTVASVKRKEQPKASLLTNSSSKKRIYGMGKTTGKEKPASVQKPKLGGN